MNPFSIIKNVFVKVWRFLISDDAQNAVRKATELAELAIPIVTALGTIDPKLATLKDVEKAYRTLAVPYLDQYSEQPESIGNALLNLATELLRRKAGPTPTNILNTAVQLAVTIYKANRQ